MKEINTSYTELRQLIVKERNSNRLKFNHVHSTNQVLQTMHRIKYGSQIHIVWIATMSTYKGDGRQTNSNREGFKLILSSAIKMINSILSKE